MPTFMKIELAQQSAEERKDEEGFSSISVFWEAADNAAGVWVKYSDDVSHKHAFSVMAEGMWKAMQDPEAYNIDRDGPNADETGNPPPYAILVNDVESR